VNDTCSQDVMKISMSGERISEAIVWATRDVCNDSLPQKQQMFGTADAFLMCYGSKRHGHEFLINNGF
jgi:hypothetical protein